ncbi:hypothetical protein KUTeg_010699 [Tegillarca granosa]|uniref:glutamyl aminopeptidase n=1 Tax=Tegillarca granosa TaxID=220873 RepID=A0ABQ9F1T2_TEGGR|nr:hypothetical protein KUTeg_010699 [Tegillarca granosa]
MITITSKIQLRHRMDFYLLDMIAIPDFSAGAMENWGLITYRETSMLFEPGVSSESNKQRVAVVIAHELAHQWFGDLVTMSWWDDLWLNEGFAAYVEYIGTNHTFPDWRMFEYFVKDVQSAMEFDGLVTSHPIYVAVSNPDEINEIFDSISYDKGASVLRMMNHFLGDETFRYGVSNYIKNRQYRNAFHDDLWNSLTNVSIKIKYKWKIPFTYTSKSESNFHPSFSDVKWIDREEQVLAVNVTSDDWVIANAQMYGYYRVNYDDQNWIKVIEQLKTNHEVIHLINRAQIINDAWALASAGELKMEIALKTIDYLKAEEDYIPWRTADGELSYNYMKNLISPLFTRLGLNNSGSDHMQIYTRSLIVSLACDFGITDCVTESLKLFKEWMNNPNNNP